MASIKVGWRFKDVITKSSIIRGHLWHSHSYSGTIILVIWTSLNVQDQLQHLTVFCRFIVFYVLLRWSASHSVHVCSLEQKLPTLPEHLSSPPIFSGVRVTRCLVLCICFGDRCLSFCPCSFGHCECARPITASNCFCRFIVFYVVLRWSASHSFLSMCSGC
jgi:hypothetical protein